MWSSEDKDRFFFWWSHRENLGDMIQIGNSLVCLYTQTHTHTRVRSYTYIHACVYVTWKREKKEDTEFIDWHSKYFDENCISWISRESACLEIDIQQSIYLTWIWPLLWGFQPRVRSTQSVNFHKHFNYYIFSHHQRQYYPPKINYIKSSSNILQSVS